MARGVILGEDQHRAGCAIAGCQDLVTGSVKVELPAPAGRAFRPGLAVLTIGVCERDRILLFQVVPTPRISYHVR